MIKNISLQLDKFWKFLQPSTLILLCPEKLIIFKFIFIISYNYFQIDDILNHKTKHQVIFNWTTDFNKFNSQSGIK